MEKVNKSTGEQLDWCIEHTQGKSGYNAKGEEIPDSTPVALPVGFRRPMSLQMRMKQLLRNEEFLRAQEAAGVETFEDADDFNCNDDDPLSSTPYEDSFDPQKPGAIAREQEIRSGYVNDIPPETKAKAKNLADKIHHYYRRKTQKVKNKPKTELKSDVEAENGENEDE